MTAISVVVVVLETVSKALEIKLNEIGGRIESIQIIALLKRAAYLEKSWRPEETCRHSDSSKNSLIRACMKNSHNKNSSISILPIDECSLQNNLFLRLLFDSFNRSVI